MEFLYISSLSSCRLINRIHQITKRDPGFAVQKFNRLVVAGFINNNIKTKVFSNPPMNAVAGKRWVSLPNETENGIEYEYAKYLNLPLIKDILVMLHTFLKVFIWGVKERKSKTVICDVLSISANIGALLASKLLGIKIVGIVTDMPGLMVTASMDNSKKRLISRGRIYTVVNKSYLSAFSFYVFLTEQMNAVINSRERPYIVMEGLCDFNLSETLATISEKAEPKVIMYAGGLHEKYGLKLLVESFCQIKREDIKLVIYGSGPFSKNLQSTYSRDRRIEYRGTAPNETVVQTELEATLLVNPRPTNEEFTKYSFPSKNIEYMVSGTPLLTTRLPGMPSEYYPYVYLIHEETVDGFKKALEDILNDDPKMLIEKGESARNFILQKKNNVVQTSRIVNLINQHF